ncbi:non-ribosomal peptide synthetase [Virgibacillus sp. Bac330]|uniref:non-ribosomal peptide synthetase n=1 Tax=Virgibacillus sp. Bac330 TaxID=2419841 RepID=UPI000EF4C626|nr:non-ribosomal peptide synthetase [Virgibacillus sp. Bac330]
MLLKNLNSDIVRINGKRIDIRKLEEEVQTYFGRKKCVIVTKDLLNKQKRTTLFVQAKSTDNISLESLVTNIKDAEIIDEVIPLSTLPLANNGSVDRNRLRDLELADHTALEQLNERNHDSRSLAKHLVLYTEKYNIGKPIHFKDVFTPEEPRDVQYVKSINEQKKEKKLAYVDGGPIHKVKGDVNNLPNMLIRATKKHPNKGMTMVNDEDETIFITYSELLNTAKRTLGGLKKAGIKPGDKVILLADSSESYFYAFWGCVMGGIIPAPMTPPKTFTENNSDIRLLKSVWETLESPQILSTNHLIENISNHQGEFKFLDIDQLVLSEPENHLPEVDPQQTAVLLFTSGSTGKPKGVIQTHQNIVNKQRAAAQFSRYESDDIFLNWLSKEHVVGLLAFHLMPVYLATDQLHVATDYVLAEPLRWMDYISEYHVTITWAPNSLFALMNDSIQEERNYHWDLSSIKRIINAGESVNHATCEKFLDNFIPFGLDEFAIKPEWGMSETCCMTVSSDIYGYKNNQGIQIIDKNHMEKEIVYCDETNPNKAIFVECGKIYPGLEMRITDHNNKVINEGEIGRFQVRGEMVLPSYYNNAKVNATAFTEDGWFDTDDLAFIKDDVVTFTGRMKDIIIVNGVNYQNVDIEACVEEIGDIDVTYTAACAVQFDGDHTDSVVVMYVSLLKDQADIEQQINNIKKHVFSTTGLNVSYVLPITREDIPKTNIGKIQRSQIVKRLKDGQYDELMNEQDIRSDQENVIQPWFFKSEWIKSNLNIKGNLKDKKILLYGGNNDINIKIQQEWEDNGAICNIVDNIDACIDFIQSNQVDYLINLTHFNINNLETEGNQRAKTYLLETNRLISEINPTQKINYYVVTRQKIIADSQSEETGFGVLEGYLKSLNQEEEKFQMTLIDVETDDPLEISYMLKHELLGNMDDEMVVYRGKRRLIQSLRLIDVNNEMQEQSKLKVSGRYIITGGTGGIGQWVSEELVTKFNADLLLIGKTPFEELDEKKKNTIRRLSQMNDKVSYVALDISTVTGLNKLEDIITDKWKGNLDGIFHLAGVGTFSGDHDSFESYCQRETIENYEKFFAPKVYGTIQLAKLLKKDTLFVSFGSVNGFFGGSGFSAYSAANSFMSAYTTNLINKGYKNCYCLNWSAWDGIGMSQDNIFTNVISEKGFIPLPGMLATYSMFAVLRTEERNVYIGLDPLNTHIKSKVYHKEELELTSTLFIEKDQEINESQMNIFNAFNDYITLDSIPIDKNNRIDRQQLYLLMNHQNKDEFVALETETEKALAEIWKEVLETEKIGKNSEFFSLGGHSLNATRLVAQIKSILHAKVALSDIFQNTSLSKMAAKIDNELANKKEQKQQIEHVVKENYDLSYAQKRVFILETIEQQRGLYNIVGAWNMNGIVDLDVLAEAVQALTRRHPMLRTTFKEVDGEPRMIVHDEMDIPFTILNLEGLPETLKEERIDETIDIECDREYDLYNGPLMYCSVVKKTNDQLVFIMSQHHIISDGWSLGVIVKELGEIYQSLLAKEEIKLPIFDVNVMNYIEWKNQEILQDKIGQSYWKNQLNTDLEVLNLPLDFERPKIQTYRGDTVVFDLSRDLKDSVEKFNRENESTMFMTLLSAYYLMLHKLTHQDDVVIGIPVAGREDEEAKDLIGMFVNSLAIRTQINPEMTLINFIKQIRSSMIEGFEHQNYPFDKLIDDMNPPRTLNNTPLFQTMFNYLSVPLKIKIDDVTVEEHLVRHKIAKYDISINILELTDKLNISFEYNIDLFEKDTIRRWLKHYIHVIRQVLANPDQTVAELQLLSSSDQEQILAINENQTNYPKNKNVVELFKESVEKYSNKSAVTFADKRLTYQELDERSEEIACELIRKGAKAGDIIGIYAERNIETIVGTLAILKIGAIYLPINHKYADNVITRMLEDCQVNLILTTGNAETHENIHYIDLRQRFAKETIYPTYSGENLTAYIMYTSGTTGNPKGVKVSHQNIVRLVKNPNWIDLSEQDVILQTGALSFDASTFEIWAALLNGMTLCLVEEEWILDAEKLKSEIARHSVSIMWLSAPLFNQLVDIDAMVLKGCEKLIVGGDVLSPKHINKLREVCPEITIINGYGPTENTTFSTTFTIDQTYENSIPIGKPISNSTAYVLNENNHLQPIGVMGELCVGGDGVALGYLNQEELTAESFVKDPFNPGQKMYRTGDFVRMDKNGLLHYLDRIDNQMKIRGFRVELDAIKFVLLNNTNIIDAVVLVQETEHNKFITTYVVQDGNKTEQEILEYLKQHLPFYLIPAKMIFVYSIPLNTNGKVDVNRLEKMKLTKPSADSELELPVKGLEKTLLELFAKTLNHSEMGVNDSFFECGGDSLLTIKVTAKLKELGFRVDPKLIFMYPTVRELAKEISLLGEYENTERTSKDYLIKTHSGNENSSRIFFAPPAGGTILGYIELSRHFKETGETYGIQAPGLYDDEQPQYLSFEEMVDFCLQAIDQTYRPGKDYLAGHSLGGHLAFAMCVELIKKDKAPKGLIILDTTPSLDLIKTDAAKNINEEDFKLLLLTMGIGNMMNVDSKRFEGLSYHEAKNVILEMSETDERIASFLNEEYLDKYLKMQLHHILMSREIVLPKVQLDIPIHVIRTTEHEEYVYELFEQWHDYTKDLNIIDMNANHTSMMKLPHVKELAEKIEKSCYKSFAH